MNYLILTPDGVGSTILQRLLTMAFHLEKHPVQNTHELTDGIELQEGILIKNYELKYSQSLGEIANIIQKQEQITLVSRLAKYHLDNRKDPATDCQDFYKFLNTHFERKIMCVRENIFEYAMSWSIRNGSGLNNLYDKEDRDIVSQVTEVDEDYFLMKCQQYVKYIEWVENNFPEVEKVSYESMVKDSDAVMQKLTGYANTFTDKIGLPLSSLLANEYNFLKNRSESSLSKQELKALVRYKQTCTDMLNKKITINVPLKSTTLTDKKNQVKNFDVCLDKFYTFARNHNWIDQSISTYDFWNEKNIC